MVRVGPLSCGVNLPFHSRTWSAHFNGTGSRMERKVSSMAALLQSFRSVFANRHWTDGVFGFIQNRERRSTNPRWNVVRALLPQHHLNIFRDLTKRLIILRAAWSFLEMRGTKPVGGPRRRWKRRRSGLCEPVPGRCRNCSWVDGAVCVDLMMMCQGWTRVQVLNQMYDSLCERDRRVSRESRTRLVESAFRNQCVDRGCRAVINLKRTFLFVKATAI